MALGAVNLTLSAATLVDLKRRSADEIRGDKRLWAVLAFSTVYGIPAGVISYFLFARRW